MSSHFAKPENALRKARDLVRVQKESSALKTLHNILISKRFRLWQPTHEQIMVSPALPRSHYAHHAKRPWLTSLISALLCAAVFSSSTWSWPWI